MSADDWAIFDHCGAEVQRWASAQRQQGRREPPEPKPPHPASAEQPPRVLRDRTWDDDDDAYDDDDPAPRGPSDPGGFGAN